MLTNASKMIGCPIMSLHVGGQIATVEQLIVDPNNLRVIALAVTGIAKEKGVGNILDVTDIREFSKIGLIINSIDDLVLPDDVIKIRDVLALDFDLNGMNVKSKKGSRMGKIKDYVINPENFAVRQLIVQRPMLKAFLDPELTIDASQVVEITDYDVIVKDEISKIKKEAEKAEFVPNFVNPFREPNYTPIRKKTPDEQDTE